jgi:hypothetical protein
MEATVIQRKPGQLASGLREGIARSIWPWLLPWFYDPAPMPHGARARCGSRPATPGLPTHCDQGASFGDSLVHGCGPAQAGKIAGPG